MPEDNVIRVSFPQRPRHDPTPMPVQLVSRGDGLVEVGPLVAEYGRELPLIRPTQSLTDIDRIKEQMERATGIHPAMLTQHPPCESFARGSLRSELEKRRYRNRLGMWWLGCRTRLCVLGLVAAFGYIFGTIFAWSPDPGEWSGWVRAFWGGSMLAGILYVMDHDL
jgi:hypothetical protein